MMVKTTRTLADDKELKHLTQSKSDFKIDVPDDAGTKNKFLKIDKKNPFRGDL